MSTKAIRAALVMLRTRQTHEARVLARDALAEVEAIEDAAEAIEAGPGIGTRHLDAKQLMAAIARQGGAK